MGNSQTVTGDAWDRKGPRGMRFHSDTMRQDLTERTKHAAMEYQVQNRPSSTAALSKFSRGYAYNDNPNNDKEYRADFYVGDEHKAKGIFYEGELSLARHRTVGLVNELIESHTDAQDPTKTQGGTKIRPLTVDEQQQKLEEMQRALLEEAAFLDRLKNMEVDHPLICEGLTGDRDKSILGGCVRVHYPCVEVDKKEFNNNCSIM